MQSPPFREVAKVFMQVFADVRVDIGAPNVSREGSDGLYLIESQDRYGPLPLVSVPGHGDRAVTLEQVERAAAKLTAVAKIRQEIVSRYPGRRFVLPVALADAFVAGVRSRGGLVLAIGPSFVEAYHNPRRKVG